ncbi:hypothetical protein SISSUDRAFT_1060152 [Sistotremastrum suecicum HHB10207 ss-3]|uniref:Uncharacterized protein n=1 Tax=Sistotremastrum suecicum HHB10207 ss-3 TaxID=1314776 RepID=A0A166FIC6_9AGAM|nr:hypothetical protein SISSUDRAFT_1060152 [Sistotremastrum suecicum HHB10207 ss-3]
MGFFSSRKSSPDKHEPSANTKFSQTLRSRFSSKKLSHDAHTYVDVASSDNRTESVNPRISTDAVTITLAERLNELSAANNEGLIDDDEFRLLRQSVFQRFAANIKLPSEPSFIPVSRPRQPTQRSSSSNFQFAARSASIRSNSSSVASQLSSFFRRPSLKHPVASPLPPDQRSVSDMTDGDLTSLSNYGTVRRSSHRTLGRPSKTTALDARSISSAKSGFTSRSTHAPSSFSPRNLSSSALTLSGNPLLNSSSPVYDEDTLTSAAAIREEISTLEKERKRLIDAFNGLEITYPSKSGREFPRREPSLTSLHEETFDERVFNLTGAALKNTSHRRLPANDNNDPRISSSRISSPQSSVISLNHALSNRFFPSASSQPRPAVLYPSHVSSAPTPTTILPTFDHTPNRPVESSRRPAIGIENIRQLTPNPHSASPHLPTLKHMVTSGVSLPDSETGFHPTESDHNDVRRRRAEVMQRYEARLEFLKAKLRAEELRERLSKR